MNEMSRHFSVFIFRFVFSIKEIPILAITPSQEFELLRKLSAASVIEPVLEWERENIVFPLCFFMLIICSLISYLQRLKIGTVKMAYHKNSIKFVFGVRLMN